MGMTETLRLVIDGSSKGAQTALGELKKAAKTTDKDLGGFGEGMNKAANVAAVGVAALTGVVLKSAYDTEKRGTAIRELMRMTGDSVKEASTLTGQWQETGLSIEEGSVAMKKFSQNMAAVASGTAKANPFEALGISVVDANGNMRDSATVLSEVRDKMAGMENSTQRTAVALTMFGKSGDDLLSWLTKTPAEIEAMNKQLGAAGLIWGPKEMKQYQDAAVAQRDLMVSLTGIEQIIAFEVVPTFTKMVEGVVWLTDRMGPAAKAIPYVTLALAGFVGVVKGVELAQTVMGWVGALSAWITKSGVAAVAEGVETTAIGVQTVAIEANTVARTANGAIPLGTGSYGIGKGALPLGAAGGTAALGGLAMVGMEAAVIASAAMAIALPIALATYKENPLSPSGSTVTGGQSIGGRGPGSGMAYEQALTASAPAIAKRVAGMNELADITKELNGLKPSATTVGAIARYDQRFDALKVKYPQLKAQIDKVKTALDKQGDAFEASSEAAKKAADDIIKAYSTMADFFKATNTAAIMGTPLPTAAQAAFASQSDQAAAAGAITAKQRLQMYNANRRRLGLSTIPGLANEGYVKARPGGTIVRVAEGGEDEFVLKASRFAKGNADKGSVLVTGNTFVGTSRDAERTLTNIVSRRLGPQTARIERGRMAMANG